MALVLNSALQLGIWHCFAVSECHEFLYGCIPWTKVYQLLSKSLSVDAVKTCSLSVHLCCLVLTIATPCLLVFLSILLRGIKESKMRQPDHYLEHPDLNTSHHSSRTFTGCLSIGESCTRSLDYVIVHYLALALNICLTLLMFTPLPDPCALPQIPVSWALPM